MGIHLAHLKNHLIRKVILHVRIFADVYLFFLPRAHRIQFATNLGMNKNQELDRQRFDLLHLICNWKPFQIR